MKGHNAIILENHGIVIRGSCLSEAFMRLEILESCAKTIINAKSIGEIIMLTDNQLVNMDIGNNLLPEFEKYEIDKKEFLLRQQICDIIERACFHGLMGSSYGTISVRQSQSKFLISPTGFNRRNVQPEDLVLIEDGRREKNKIPSKTIKIHQNIYKSHTELQCIILTQSPYACHGILCGQQENEHQNHP